MTPSIRVCAMGCPGNDAPSSACCCNGFGKASTTYPRTSTITTLVLDTRPSLANSRMMDVVRCSTGGVHPSLCACRMSDLHPRNA